MEEDLDGDGFLFSFFCGLYRRNFLGLNLKYICFRVCYVGYYFVIFMLFDFYVKVFFCFYFVF